MKYVKLIGKNPPEPPIINLLEESSPVCSKNMIPADQESNQFTSSSTMTSNAPIRKRELSCRKRVGSRCYARWPGNSAYFWGYIMKAYGHGPHRKYSVSLLCFGDMNIILYSTCSQAIHDVVIFFMSRSDLTMATLATISYQSMYLVKLNTGKSSERILPHHHPIVKITHYMALVFAESG
jgi:hypothetical protein